jgi:hypothetical protein
VANALAKRRSNKADNYGSNSNNTYDNTCYRCRENALVDADAAIAAYETHRPRADVVLTREEWGHSVTRAQIEWWTSQDKDDETAMSLTLCAAFLFIRVEGE